MGAGESIAHPFHLVPIVKAHLEPASIEALLQRTDGEVERIEADCVVKALGVQTNPPYHLDRIDSCGPYCAGTAPSDDRYDYGDARGDDALIYIIDTGVRISHSDFGGRAVAGFSARCPTGYEDDCTSRGGQWLYQGVVTPSEGSSCDSIHGTHCAGTAAGTKYGVAKGATIVAVQGLACTGSGTTSDEIAGIEWSVDDAQRRRAVAAVISMSLGGGANEAEDRAIAAAHDASAGAF